MRKVFAVVCQVILNWKKHMKISDNLKNYLQITGQILLLNTQKCLQTICSKWIICICWIKGLRDAQLSTAQKKPLSLKHISAIYSKYSISRWVIIADQTGLFTYLEINYSNYFHSRPLFDIYLILHTMITFTLQDHYTT